ncbi:MAG: arsenical-resistance protein [Spirochaetes bacterium GWF1_51_8]|nr:MAG: arsenical-resistance protein [Spirochaetes bacterium GWF1_51_8]
MEKAKQTTGLGVFEKFLTVWVIVCIALGVAVGKFLPDVPRFLGTLEYAHVSIPVAILIWLMIYPMMLKIDFSGMVRAVKQPKGLAITLVTNWVIKPFTMYGISWFFLKVVFAGLIPETLSTEYLAGAVFLGAAPCTAMVFVWSHLTKGEPAFTLVQVAVNDLIILALYAPIVAFLLGLSNVPVPWDTLILSVVLFVVVPLSMGYLTRVLVIKKKGEEFFRDKFVTKFNSVTVIGLLLTLVIIFSFQGETILGNYLHILLIAVPFIIQTFFIFALAYFWARLWKLPHSIASPAAMIGASNFFELAVAVAIALFGLKSGAALASVVGVLVEVPVMLTLVMISNKSRKWFNKDVLEEYGIE